jgi:hypothetical protein
MTAPEKKAPYPPEYFGVSLDADFTALPPEAGQPWLLQVRIAMQPIDQARDQARTHTTWFALTPAMAREMANALKEAADRASTPRTPGSGSMQ